MLKATDLISLSDDALLDAVQRQTFDFFWQAAHPDSGLARDRCRDAPSAEDDLVVSGGSGFGIMSLIVATARGWVSRQEATERLERMLNVLVRATCYHG